LEQGGCVEPSSQWQARIDRKYGARLAAIHEKIIDRYGDGRANADVIIAGACLRLWDEFDGRQKVEAGLKYWEACLGIKPSRRVVNCPR
jgi:hypothetical protein